MGYWVIVIQTQSEPGATRTLCPSIVRAKSACPQSTWSVKRMGKAAIAALALHVMYCQTVFTGPSGRCYATTQCLIAGAKSYVQHPPGCGPRAKRLSCAAALDPWKLGSIAAEPVVKVALLCGAGLISSKRGILTLQGRRMLSGLVMNVFTPALLLSKLGSSVDARQALELWPLAANMAVCHAVGLLLGWTQGKLLDIPEALRPQMVVMNTVGNIGNLPLVLVPSLVANPEVSLPAATEDLGITYVMLGFFCASFIQFPVGYLLLQEQQQQSKPQQQQQQPAPRQLPSDAKSANAAAGRHSSTTKVAAATAAVLQSTAQGELNCSTDDNTMPAALPPQQQQQQLQTLFKGVLTPPVIACLLAVPVASVPQLRDALFTPSGSLSAVGECISLLGEPLIPCLFLVLGANLAEGPGAAQVPPKVIASLVLSKLVLHPLAGMAVVLGGLHSGLLPPSTDELELLVMMLVWSTPTAVLVHSLATMLQDVALFIQHTAVLVGSLGTVLQAGEDQVSCLLFWQYLSSLIALPAFMAVYLQLLQTGQLLAPATAATGALS